MNLSNIHNIYFIGIGGIGMSAIARYFNANNKLVAGYDKTQTTITDTLVELGVQVHFDDDVSSYDLMIYDLISVLFVCLVVQCSSLLKCSIMTFPSGIQGQRKQWKQVSNI